MVEVEIVDERDQLEEILSRHSVAQTMVSSVGSEDLTKFVISLTERPIVLDDQTPLPIKNGYKTPKTLGKDRLANAVAAYHYFNNHNSLVIDAGTCLKFDFINESNEYLGGSISPGLTMRFKALNTFTDKLPLVNPEDSEPVEMGVDTLTSIHTGCYTGMNREIEATIAEYKKMHGDLKILITGGDMDQLQKMGFSQKNSIFADRWLTLKGLNKILSHNAKS